MYKSMIEVISTGIQTTIENGVYKAVESYGIKVDKNELLRALVYDRSQYEKGYSDGLNEGLKHDEILELLKEIQNRLQEAFCLKDTLYHSAVVIDTITSTIDMLWRELNEPIL